MKIISKALVGSVAAGAMAMATASPAQARDYRDRDDGIDAGDVIAGALIIGGIAAIASAANNDRGYRDGYRDRDYRGYDRRYDRRDSRGYDARAAVERCVRAAESTANRYSYGGGARVTDIREIDRERDGYEIKGRIAVNQIGRDWRGGDGCYGRGWNSDYRGWNDRYRGYDSGRFSCDVRYGRVTDLDFSGIRGL